MRITKDALLLASAIGGGGGGVTPGPVGPQWPFHKKYDKLLSVVDSNPVWPTDTPGSVTAVGSWGSVNWYSNYVQFSQVATTCNGFIIWNARIDFTNIKAVRVSLKRVSSGTPQVISYMVSDDPITASTAGDWQTVTQSVSSERYNLDIDVSDVVGFKYFGIHTSMGTDLNIYDITPIIGPYIYLQGDECEQITGGWFSNPIMPAHEYWSKDPAKFAYVPEKSADANYGFCTRELIDLTNADSITLAWDGPEVRTGTSYYPVLKFYNTDYASLGQADFPIILLV